MTKRKTVFLIAGEASGDHYAAAFMRQLNQLSEGSIRYIGVGGPHMEAQGLRSLFPMQELSHMGIVELLPQIPNLLSRIRELVTVIEKEKPDIVVTIDCPDFSLRVAKHVQHLSIPLFHCVAPSVWAWRAGRAKKLAFYLDHLITLFPFEPPYFLEHGLSTTFCGHPMVEQEKGCKESFFQAYPALRDKRLVCLLPGSRAGEIKRLLPDMLEVAKRLVDSDKTLAFVLPAYEGVHPLIKKHLQHHKIPVTLVDPCDKWHAFDACDVALAASGTVALELAFAGLPMVIVYRVAFPTALLGRLLIKTPFVSLVNILAGHKVVDELLQEDCTVDAMEASVRRLLTHETEREKQKKAFDAIIRQLSSDEGKTPSQKVAGLIWHQLRYPLHGS